MAANLTPSAQSRILALIAAYPDAFSYCLGELASDSNLYCDAEYAKSVIDNPSNTPAGKAEYRDMIDGYEAIREAARIISDVANATPAPAPARALVEA